MAFRVLEVELRANVAGFAAQMGAAAASTRQFASEATKAATSHRQAAQTLGKVGVIAGGAVVAGMAAATAAAIKYETAFAGVRKTIDASEAEFAQLSNGIREMSRRMPASAIEIAGVAEAAGQLGVQKGAILGFTETMIQLGESTNLTADEAATSMAKIANIMGTPQTEVDRLGAALVDLGNNGASTEVDIVSMATRIASAGTQIGLTEGEVLGFANALSSVGIEAEAGGSAISRVMISTRNAVMDGGEALETFAATAGMSAEEFQTAFKENAGGAIISFIEGLGNMEKAGQNSNVVLDKLALSDIRVGNALRAAASSGDLFRESLELGNKAYGENSALTEEYERRLQTTAAQLEIARNNIVDLAIGLGDKLLPVVRSVADGTTDLLTGIKELPPGLQAVVAGTVGVTGALAAAGGAFLLLAPRVVEVVKLYKTMAAAHPGLASGLGTLGVAAGAATVTLALYSMAVGNARRQSEDLFDAMTKDVDFNSVESIGQGIDQVSNKIDSFYKKFEVNNPFDYLHQISEGFGELFTPMENEMLDAGDAIDYLTEKQGELVRAQHYTRENTMLLARDMGITEGQVQALAEKTGTDLTGSYEDVAAAIGTAYDELAAGIPVSERALMSEEELAEAAKKLAEIHERLGDSYGSFTDPMSAYQDALQRQAEQTAVSTGAMASSWAEFANDADVSLSEFNDSLERQLAAQANWKDNLLKIAQMGHADLASELAAMGEEGVVLTQKFADGSAAEVQRGADLMVRHATDGGREMGAALDQELRAVAMIAEAGAGDTVQSIANELQVAPDVVRWHAARAGVALKEETGKMETTGRVGGSSVASALNTTMAAGLFPFGGTVGAYAALLLGGMNPVLRGIGKAEIAAASPWAGFNRAVGLAEGGLIDFYASGGFHEDHVAQIAPAGAWRVWAEDETGGEAYIPLARASGGLPSDTADITTDPEVSTT